MATEAQIQANQANSLRSTGPKTPEGKDASRRNAYKHGLTASAEFIGDEDVELFDERIRDYALQFVPADAHEDELVRELAVDSIRAERGRALFTVLVNDFAIRAQTCWDLDRRAEAEALATRLAREPGRVSHALRATRFGTELLIERWDELAASLESGGSWDDAERSMALDLLGVHPDLRRGRTRVDAPDGTDPAAFRLRLIAAEVGRLKASKARCLDAWDDRQRALAEDSFGAELSKPLQLLHRYEMSLQRRRHAALRHFEARDRGARPRPVSQAPTEPDKPRARSAPPRLAAALALTAGPDPDANANAAPTVAAAGSTPAARPLTKRQRRLLSKRRREHEQSPR